MSDKDVTDRQGLEFARMSRSKGIGSEPFQQRILNSGTGSRFVDAVNRGWGIAVCVPEIVAPEDGRLLFINIETDLSKPLSETISLMAPSTPRTYDVWQADEDFLPFGEERFKERLVLLNYPSRNGGWEKAMSWAKKYWLEYTDLRHVLPLKLEDFPDKWRGREVQVVATTECVVQSRRLACSVNLDSQMGKQARRLSIRDYGNTRDWLAFMPAKPWIFLPTNDLSGGE